MILNWIRKRFGYHVCEEFTQWEDVTRQMVRAPTEDEVWNGGKIGTMIEYIEKWQLRRCTMCGKIETRQYL